MLVHAGVAWVQGRELRHNCSLLLRGGAIEAVLDRRQGERLGADSAYLQISADLVLPGLINAHCHLEYTGMEGRLPRGRVPFGEWIGLIQDAKSGASSPDAGEAVRTGANRLLLGGCTTVIDSLSQPQLAALYDDLPIRTFLLYEVLGLTESRAEGTLAAAEAKLAEERSSSPLRLGEGLNPHAPYSVGEHLAHRLGDLFRERPGLSCAWHLGETPDETELLERGSGSIAEFLRKREIPFPPRTVAALPGTAVHSAPVRYLQEHGLLASCDLAFHGNCLARSDLPLFAAPRAIVHCPGTHAYFERPAFDLENYLRGGANVCLGTDSLASSDTLSMWEVLQLIANAYPSLGTTQLLDLATRNAACTKPLAGTALPLGVIAPQAAADLLLLKAERPMTSSLRTVVADPSTRVQSTIVAGAMAEPFRSAG